MTSAVPINALEVPAATAAESAVAAQSQGDGMAQDDVQQTVVSLRMVSSTGALGSEQHFNSANVTIGRRAQNMVTLNDMTVSGTHAEIRRKSDGSGYELCDMKSRNGTLVDGNAVECVDLRDGDEFEVGIFRLAFRALAAPASGVAEALERAQLDYLSGGMSGIKQRLERTITRVSASGQVVVVARRKTGWFVTHMEGANRTLVNGKPLGGQAMSLVNNDILEMNTTRIRFRLL